MIQIVDVTEQSDSPICPHCERDIKKLKAKKMESILGVRYLYFCSDCSKALGVSHRKGFWMG